tara:strand:+ start:536 stop:937 length:402 start_codon:yes stop_codon:yes gene_type:complete
MDKALILNIILSGFLSGLIIFQTLLAAPIVFTSLKQDQARIFIRKVFPRLFKFLYLIGLLMLVVNFLSNSTYILLYIVSSLTFIFPLICALMVDVTNKATDDGNKQKFKFLHTLSVILTMIVLILNLFWAFFI